MNKEKDITAKLHNSKEAEVKLFYERGELIVEAEEGKEWDKLDLTKSQYLQGLLGITRPEVQLAKDIHHFLHIFANESMSLAVKDFEGFTKGKLELIMSEMNGLWESNTRENNAPRMREIITNARNMPFKDLRDWLNGEDDDGKCTPDCPWRVDTKISYFCETHKKRVYTDPRIKLDK